MMSVYQLPLRGHQKTSSNPEEFIHQQILSYSNESLEDHLSPPALPPKNIIAQNYEDNESGTNSDSTSESMPLPPIPPIKQQNHHNNANSNCLIIQSCCTDYDINPENILPCCIPHREDVQGECKEICFCDNPPPQ